MVNVMWRGCRALEFYVERATTSEGWIPAIAMGAAFFMVVLDTSIVNLARDADDMARRSSVLPCLRQPIPRSLAAWAAAQPMGVAGRMPAAIALATGTVEGRKAAILWNIFGFADLAVAITLGMIISPGPFQLIVPNSSSIGLDGYPNVLTPAFVVPGSILLHALSLR
jgi:hypothetical protein